MRLTRADRRDQLLDVAADLVLARGPASVTIERVAHGAGVSRALAYQHFDNAEEVLLAVYRREVAQLAEDVLAAVARPAPPEERLRAAVRRFLEVVRTRGALFTVLAAASSPIATRADDGTRAGPRFVAELLATIFDLPLDEVRIAASLSLGALHGGVEAWSTGEVSLVELEDAAVALVLALLHERPRPAAATGGRRRP